MWLDVDVDKDGSKRTVFDGIREWWRGSVGELNGARGGFGDGGGGGERTAGGAAATQNG